MTCLCSHRGRRTYSSSPFATTALEGVSVQRHILAALTWAKTRHPLYGALGRPRGRSAADVKPHPTGFDPWTVQDVASNYRATYSYYETCYLLALL
jgi:hypothetical protein